MICVADEISLLTRQEQQLHQSLDNLRGQRSLVKEHKQLEKELTAVLRKRQNLQAYNGFELGMPVHRLNSSRLGIVKELKITLGGMGEVWVSWDGLLQMPEQPNLLQIDGAAMARIIAVGDLIKIFDGHQQAGEIFTVERLLARGAVETTDEQIFEREEWQKVYHPFQSAGDEELIQSAIFNQEILMGSLPTEELEEGTPETTLTITATVQLEELTEDEEQERHRLELKVERAFVEAGTALRQLRDERLYRSTHKTFEEYCRDRFGFSRAHPYRLIDAAKVVENLSAINEQNNLSPNGRQILPTNERQVRDLVELDSNEQFSVWQQAVDESGGKVPSGRIVKGIIDRLKEKPLVKASDFCTVGDAFILTRLEGAERKYNGCWAIASQLRDFTVVVDVYDGEIAVKPDNVNPIDLPDVRRQLPETLKRIKRLRDCGLLDRCVYHFLEGVGRQIYLTDLEADLLTYMEERYGVGD
jgi:hypothetical protein